MQSLTMKVQVPCGQQIKIEIRLIANKLSSITHNSAIFSMSIPNVNVIMHYYRIINGCCVPLYKTG